MEKKLRLRVPIFLTIASLLLSLSSCPAPGGPGNPDPRTLTVTGMTYPWANCASSFTVHNVEGLDPSFTVPGGRGVHRVTLTYITTSANAPAFTIKADALPAQAITAGSSATYNNKTVALAGGAGTYTLTIELPNADDTFTSAEDWKLGITGLSTTGADNTVTVSSTDTAGAAISPEPVCFPYAWSTTGSTTAMAAVKIPGGVNVDEVVMYLKIESSGTPVPTFRVLPILGTSTTTYSIAADGSPWPSDGIINNNSGYNFTLSLVSGLTNTWMLEIRRDSPSLGDNPPAFASDLASVLVIRSLSTTEVVYFYCASRDSDLFSYVGSEALDFNLSQLNQPPRPMITMGGNGTVGGLSLSVNAQNTEAFPLTYSWTVSDGITPQVFSTQQNPGTNPFTLAGYSSNGNYTITCVVTEMLATLPLDLNVPIITQTGSCQAGVSITD